MRHLASASAGTLFVIEEQTDLAFSFSFSFLDFVFPFLFALVALACLICFLGFLGLLDDVFWWLFRAGLAVRTRFFVANVDRRKLYCFFGNRGDRNNNRDVFPKLVELFALLFYLVSSIRNLHFFFRASFIFLKSFLVMRFSF